MPCGEDNIPYSKRVKRKEVVDFHINETTLTDTNKPADFSFHGLSELTPLGCENARATRLGEPPEKHSVSRKFLTKGLWLNNNKLISLKGLHTFVANIIDKPELLTYIDLSFNKLSVIDEELIAYKNLTVLYFHGNHIMNFFEIVKLGKLKKLRNVTFHGNPISVDPHYRSIAILSMSTIVHLDHKPVLKSERKQPPHPEALEMLRGYQKDRKTQDNDYQYSHKDLIKADATETKKIDSDIKSTPVKLEEKPGVKPKIKTVPGITSEFIKKRQGICSCCNQNCA